MFWVHPPPEIFLKNRHRWVQDNVLKVWLRHSMFVERCSTTFCSSLELQISCLVGLLCHGLNFMLTKRRDISRSWAQWYEVRHTVNDWFRFEKSSKHRSVAIWYEIPQLSKPHSSGVESLAFPLFVSTVAAHLHVFTKLPTLIHHISRGHVYPKIGLL